jgi:hypothetical protein
MSTDKIQKVIESEKAMKWTLILLLLIFSNSSIAEWVPFSLKNNHIQIDIEFNGIPAKAVLDTGSEVNAVSTYWVEKYGEGIRKSGEIEVIGIVGSQKRSQYSKVPVKLFGVEFVLNNMVGLYPVGGGCDFIGCTVFQELHYTD